MPHDLVHESEEKLRAHFFAHGDPLSDWTSYPRESFREGLCNHRRWFVCLPVCLLPRLLNKTWTVMDEIFWEGS